MRHNRFHRVHGIKTSKSLNRDKTYNIVHILHRSDIEVAKSQFGETEAQQKLISTKNDQEFC